MVDINDFEQEKTCTYKDEDYLVRDNGAVMRMAPKGKKARPLDNVWTFGKKKTAACRMIGNAFPPPVAKAVGFEIRRCLENE